MLAVSTTDGLHLIAPTTFKNPPATLEPSFRLEQAPSATAWASDNSALFLAHSHAIEKYSTDGSIPVHSLDIDSPPISHLVCSDKGNTLILSAGSAVHILENAISGPRITRSLETHKLPVQALSLSHDHTLLASIAADAAHVHNLGLSSHTILRGLPLTPTATTIATCGFHLHVRTRLLLGIGRQLVVYDTTRPSSPTKVISTGEAEVAFIACSPFSKTLVAVASTSGVVSLVDLEKDKSIVRTLHVSTPLTSLVFSPEGGALYLGTQCGKLLIQNLRELDKPPKSVTVSSEGYRVMTLSIQRKIKSEAASKTASTMAKSSRTPPGPISQRVESTAGPSIASRPGVTRARMEHSPSGPSATARVASGVTPAKARVKSTAGSANNTPTLTRNRRAAAQPDRATPATKKVFSPVRDPLGNVGLGGDISVQIESLASMTQRAAPGKKRVSPSTSVMPSVLSPTGKLASAIRIRAAAVAPTQAPRTRTVSSSSRITGNGTAKPARLHASRKPPTDSNGLPSPSSAASRLTSQTISSTHFGASASASRASASTATGTTTRSARTTPPSSISRTPSPDLPVSSVVPVTPLAPRAVKGKARALPSVVPGGVLTPDVDAWATAGAGRESRKVGFVPPEEDSDIEELQGRGVHDEPASESNDAQPELSMQISPRRPTPTAWVPSPLRSHSGGAGVGASGAQDLLRTLVRDALADVQQDSRAELVGLRLDLLALGRTWRRELRDGLGGLTDEVKLLREENERLREENERLRRGY